MGGSCRSRSTPTITDLTRWSAPRPRDAANRPSGTFVTDDSSQQVAADSGSRLAYCPQFGLRHRLRIVEPNALLTTTWPEFAQHYQNADVAVVVCDTVEADLPARLITVARQHPLPALMVVIPFTSENLLAFRRTSVDEFVELSAMATALPAALQRCTLQSAREHLAQHVEHLERMGPALRATLARALREPAALRTIQGSAESAGVTARTLENQWKSFQGPAGHSRLEDQLWLIRLMLVLELRSAGAPLESVCRTFNVEVRSLRRACRRFLGCPLALISPAAATSQVLLLKRQLLAHWR